MIDEGRQSQEVPNISLPHLEAPGLKKITFEIETPASIRGNMVVARLAVAMY